MNVDILAARGLTRRGGDSKGLKVLIVSTDSRPMHDKIEDNDYVGMSGVLMNDYAIHHGYDLLKLSFDSHKHVEEVRAKYPAALLPNAVNSASPVDYEKYGKSAYHPGLDQFRASSWSKLPLLWHATEQYGEHYDYIWYFDSDAVINPKFKNISLSDSFEKWKNDNTTIYWGNQNISESELIFFSNFPWRRDMPCAGIFLFKPKKFAKSFLKEWWDYDLPSRNFEDFMEQSALWLMLLSQPKLLFLINANTTSLLNEREFPSEWNGLNDLWLLHVPNYWPNRVPYFKNLLHMIGMSDSIIYKEQIKEIRRHSHIFVNLLAVTEAMDNHILMTLNNIDLNDTKFLPIHHMVNSTTTNINLNNNLNTPFNSSKIRRIYHPVMPNKPNSKGDYRWHLHKVTDSESSLKPPSTELLLEGLMITFNIRNKLNNEIEYFLIQNGKRRQFLNLEIFISFGYTPDMAVIFKAKSKEIEIPLGEAIIKR